MEIPAALRRAHTLPAHLYVDRAVHELERERIFAREWLLAAHESQIPEPGDALAQDLVDWPVVLVRGEDRVVRGFHNVCRHRAGPLLWEGECRRQKTLQCRYHGWTYGLDGALLRTPGFGAAQGFDPADHGLHALRVETWRGCIFANLDPAAKPLLEQIGAFAAAAEPVPMERLHFHSSAHHEIACNWKAYVENYLEGYHIPFLHPSLSREVEVKAYRVEVGDGFVEHRVPPRHDVAEPVYGGFWAWLAPNAALNVYGSGMSIERMLPTGPTTMRLEYLFLFRDLSPEAEAEREAALAMCHRVTDEDRRVCEAVQRNLAAGVYERGRLSPRHENGVHAFQERIRAALGGAAA